MVSEEELEQQTNVVREKLADFQFELDKLCKMRKTDTPQKPMKLGGHPVVEDTPKPKYVRSKEKPLSPYEYRAYMGIKEAIDKGIASEKQINYYNALQEIMDEWRT